VPCPSGLHFGRNQPPFVMCGGEISLLRGGRYSGNSPYRTLRHGEKSAFPPLRCHKYNDIKAESQINSCWSENLFCFILLSILFLPAIARGVGVERGGPEVGLGCHKETILALRIGCQ